MKTDIPISLAGGLPTIIPGVLRKSLRTTDHLNIRGILSVFAAYRVISIPGKVKISTITDPFKGLSDTLPDYEIRVASGELFGFNRLKLQPISLSLLGAAGPNHPVSILGV